MTLVTVRVRPEAPSEAAAIRVLTDAAFAPSPDEGRIVDALRGSPAWLPELSLVAVDEDEVPERIVGHCVTSVGELITADGATQPILGLGPVSVLPDRQGQGIGGALIRATVERASADGWPVIVLLGHPAYYPRFGFESARALGIQPQADWPDAAWMARRLPAWTADLRGVMRYPSAFGID